MSDTQQSEALAIINELQKRGINPYPEKFNKTHTLGQTKVLLEERDVSSAGRLITIRVMGKLTFCHLFDYTGRMQIVLEQNELGEAQYEFFHKHISRGDFIGIHGKIFTTKKGEKSILVHDFTLLGKALLGLPDKWEGLSDQELRYRKRYLDLIGNSKTMPDFLFRSNLIRTIREFYWAHDFQEVETPTLMHKATGAVATPYVTHNNALDIDVYLRISHELPLKELIVGGFERIFEIGKAFRNEGQDVSHLPEHTHLEHYSAYWNYEDNIKFVEDLFTYIFEKLCLSSTIKMEDGVEISYIHPWQKLNFIELLQKQLGIDVHVYQDAKKLRNDLIKKEISFEGMQEMSLAGLIDNLYKKVVRPKLIHPTFLYAYPSVAQPLARTNDNDHLVVDQFQLVINGWEIVKAYSELVDPLEQEKRFKEQTHNKVKGEKEIMEIDDDYINAMGYGMPPISGVGIGIDRLVALLLGKSNLRDVVLFPLMRPK